ncbi:carbohydrate kinase [Pelagicoccus enzymogenes]|uniref:carbohydrate kinase family protein n=1 Tax=Pelagicoccus enzymogenes TaxID=2773457 RepID=UPI00280ED33F|nr:carbohydrate kinase [Pelagicoccus enzymogenes]MDQ8197149.1 carbohydrate kinase [Pelagicoccus enzymogenes]
MNGSICCLGEALVDFVSISNHRRLIDAEAFKPCAGGAPANVAVGIGRLGGQASLISCLGQDVWGDFLFEALKREGVDVRGVQRTGASSTTQAFVSVDEKGERDFSFIRSPGADTMLSDSRLDEGTLDACSVLHIGTFSFSSEPSRSASLEAVRRVKSHGGLVSLDVNYRASVWIDESEAIRCVESLLPSVDILKVSQEEARMLTGLDDLASAAKRLKELGPKLVLVSLDADGCLCMNDLVRFQVPAFRVECVDATGAGDSFIAAFLQRFVELGTLFEDVAKLEEACRFACAAASITVTGRGAIPSLPIRGEVENVLSGSRRRLAGQASA